MRPLEKTLRNRLERTVKEARDIAEAAARAALEQLGVGDAAPYAHLSAEERELRRRLRVHARQLGDGRNGGTEVQEIARLIEETAYEHWHRMLFASFLSENHLLMYPDPDNPVAVTLEECEDLAAEEGAKNGWSLASRFAARMLPQIFRPDSPVFELTLPPEHQQKLERLLDNLPVEVFTASDSLGWVYQFWQARKKDEVNASEVKIGALELPAVTQLFTEPYMVSFLLDNSLGAWWVATVAGLREQGAGKELRPGARQILRTANSEEELREFFSLPGVPLEYLRFVKQEIPLNPPLPKGNLETGTTETPPPLKKGGEGGFIWLPAAGTFDIWPGHLSELKTLDPCCGSGHFLVAALLMLVPMRMELEGLSAQEAVDAVLRDNLHGLEIDRRCVELAAFALALTAWRYSDAGGYRQLPEMNVACSGLAISAKKEEWLALAGYNTNLRMALEELYKQFKDAPVLGSLINPEIGLAKGSLFELKWEEVGPLLTKALAGEKDDEKTEMGVVAQGLAKAAILLASRYHWVITNVPYLGRRNQCQLLMDYLDKNFYEGKQDLATSFIQRIAEYGQDTGASALVLPQNWLFLKTYEELRAKLINQTSLNVLARLGSGAFETITGEVVKAVLLISKNHMSESNIVYQIDSSSVSYEKKAFQLISSGLNSFHQKLCEQTPGNVIPLSVESGAVYLEKLSGCYQGITSGDNPQYMLQYWEPSSVDGSFWKFIQGSPNQTDTHAGKEQVIKWENGNGGLSGNPKARVQGQPAWSKTGVVVNRMTSLPVTIYNGALFDMNSAVLVPYDAEHLSALWCYCESGSFATEVRKVDQKLNVTNANLLKIPFDLDHWTKVAADKYPNGLPKPYSDDPTQWIFHGHPARSDSPLQVAVVRLLGYRWPAELDSKMGLSDEARGLVKRCDDLLPYADKDGIVCIPPVRGEAPAADRLLNLLAAAYGDTWSSDILSGLLRQSDHAGKTLETWLREKFFIQHCRLFHHRPFIWHIWDGLRDGFAALVNYHKLDHKNLETLIYTYLGDWINRQRQDITNGVDGARERLAVAENLKKRLELILEGEKPYDIFVRWKPIEKQPISWDPDLNDGVRLNIRPFMSVPDAGKRGAGVLRDKPNVAWEKDRGKDVESALWYHLGLQYGGKEGDRINDRHLSLAGKQKARAAVKESTDNHGGM